MLKFIAFCIVVFSLHGCSSFPVEDFIDSSIKNHSTSGRYSSMVVLGGGKLNQNDGKPRSSFARVAGDSDVIENRGNDGLDIISCPGKRIEYIPIPPIVAGGYVDIEVLDGKAVAILKPWPSGPDSAKKVNSLLTEISTNIAKSENSGSGDILSQVSGSGSKVQYVIDFMKFRVEPMTTMNGNSVGWARVGAGMRIIIDITKGDLSVSGSLVSLAANVRASKVDGNMSVELVGIDSPALTAAQPISVDLSDSNIQRVIEALAVVKAKLYDSDATLSPKLIARLECSAVSSKKT